jgi:hypothetical protein
MTRTLSGSDGLEHKTDRVRGEKVARPTGFEPVAPSSGGWCSIQLSYGRVFRQDSNLRPRDSKAGAAFCKLQRITNLQVLPRDHELNAVFRAPAKRGSTAIIV